MFYEQNKERILAQQKVWYAENVTKVAKRQKSRLQSDPQRSMYNAAKHRAKKNGIVFDISLEDIVIPELCPIFGIPLSVGIRVHNGSPSIDRLDPAKGYTKDNVWVISWFANRIKSNANLDQLRKLVVAVEAEFAKRKLCG